MPRGAVGIAKTAVIFSCGAHLGYADGKTVGIAYAEGGFARGSYADGHPRHRPTPTVNRPMPTVSGRRHSRSFL